MDGVIRKVQAIADLGEEQYVGPEPFRRAR
jgi:hypothetical protein